jgi:phosphatidylserine/phosphatidylglycerophosphate/cardiolipin synthase-like enzyme
MRSLVSIALGLVLTAGSALHVSARGGVMDALSGITSKLAPSSTHAPASPSVEVAFSPKEGAEQLVIKVIDSADRELRVAAYSFTSKPIVQALVDAKKKRGVDVRVIVDYRNNFVEGCSAGRACAGKHAVNALVNAGIPVRVISKYPIFHHKFVVANGKDVENG